MATYPIAAASFNVLVNSGSAMFFIVVILMCLTSFPVPLPFKRSEPTFVPATKSKSTWALYREILAKSLPFRTYVIFPRLTISTTSGRTLFIMARTFSAISFCFGLSLVRTSSKVLGLLFTISRHTPCRFLFIFIQTTGTLKLRRRFQKQKTPKRFPTQRYGAIDFPEQLALGYFLLIKYS